MTIKMYELGDKVFLKACELAKVKSTRRQFRKYQRGFGSARSYKTEAHDAIHNVPKKEENHVSTNTNLA